MLRLRGLEQRREQEQERLGLSGLPFREILTRVPAETAEVLQPLFENLSQRLSDFRSVSDSAKDAIEVNLHNIQATLASSETGAKTYTPDRTPQQTTDKKHFTSRSV